MTAWVTVTDEQTSEVVRPPCEITGCLPVDASWIARFQCGNCGASPHQLMCNRHLDYFAAGAPARCTSCEVGTTTDYWPISIELLR